MHLSLFIIILTVFIATASTRPGRDTDSEEEGIVQNQYRQQQIQNQRPQKQRAQQQNTDTSSSSESTEEWESSDFSSLIGVESSLIGMDSSFMQVTTIAPEVVDTGNVTDVNNGTVEPGLNEPRVDKADPTFKPATTKPCQTTCPLEYQPVCSTDNITYPSRCVFEAIKCNDPTLTATIKNEGSCVS